MSLRVELSLAALTWRLLLGRRRWLALPRCNGFPIFVSWIFIREEQELRAAEALEFSQILMATVVLSVLLPLASLIFGAMAMGQEIEDGTLAYSLSKPTARWRLITTKVFVAWVATLATILPGVWAAGWIVLGSPAHVLVRGFTVGLAVAALLYVAGFLALSLYTRRALIFGLVYVIGWEGSLSRFFDGTKTLSVREYATSLAQAVSDMRLEEGLASPLQPSTSVILSAVLLSVLLGVAIGKLRTLELLEEA
jgi:ABC-2 type transport system permease protein